MLRLRTELEQALGNSKIQVTVGDLVEFLVKSSRVSTGSHGDSIHYINSEVFAKALLERYLHIDGY